MTENIRPGDIESNNQLHAVQYNQQQITTVNETKTRKKVLKPRASKKSASQPMKQVDLNVQAMNDSENTASISEHQIVLAGL